MSVSPIETEDSLLARATDIFIGSFGTEPDTAVSAPGRVNLIGEHTDYNEGFVFPMALPMVTVIVGKRSSHCMMRIQTLSKISSQSSYFELPNDLESIKPVENHWVNYVLGVIACKMSAESSKIVPSFDMVIASSVPLGGGLSSSASLEVAMYTFLEALSGSSIANNTKDKAMICQKAEHTYANMPCGIMDQFVSVLGQKGHALLIDCRSMIAELVPMNNPDVVILITNSNVKHKLTGSEYPLRRMHCHEAAKIMNQNSLRTVTKNELLDNKSKMDLTIFKRASHVISENDRCQRALQALKSSDFKLFGDLMLSSHYSLKDDFEVSCPELDELVNLASEVNGVYGSRMTGGGFGGCTVTLLNREAVSDVVNHITKNYSGSPTFYTCQASDGAKIIKSFS